jgi:MFS family permease
VPWVRADATLRRTILALMAVTGAGSLAMSLPVPALPAIQDRFACSASATALTLTAFYLTAAVTTPFTARCGDRFGRRAVLVGVLGLLVAGSIVCGLAGSIDVFIAGRVLQGVSGGVLPLAAALVREQAGPEAPGGLGAIAAAFGAGNAAGPVIGGFLADRFGFHGFAWFLLVLALACVVIARRWLRRAPGSRPGLDLKLPSAALLGVPLASVLFGLTKLNVWGVASPGFALTVGGGGCLLVAWGLREWGSGDPFVDVRLLARRAVLAPNLSAFVVSATTAGFWFLIPMLAHADPVDGYGLGASLSVASLFLLPPAAVLLLGGRPVGEFAGRFGGRGPALAGILATSAGLASLALAHSSAMALLFGGALVGVGLSAFLAAMAVQIAAAVPTAGTAEAMAVNTIVRMVGATLGAQVSVAILSASWLPRTVTPSSGGYTAAFGVMAAACAALGLAAALWAPRGQRALAGASAVRTKGAFGS